MCQFWAMSLGSRSSPICWMFCQVSFLYCLSFLSILVALRRPVWVSRGGLVASVRAALSCWLKWFMVLFLGVVLVGFIIFE